MVKVSKAIICAALNAVRLSFAEGYQNVHLLPLYQKKIAFGSKKFTWAPDNYKGNIFYEKGISLVAETLYESTFFYYGFCRYNFSDKYVDLVIKSFQKVWDKLVNL